MVASDEPSARLMLFCRSLWRAAVTAATLSGSRINSAITTPARAPGAPTAAMPDGLGVEEHGIEQDGHHADEDELRRRIDRPRRGQCVVRKDQRDGRQDEQHTEIDI